MSLHGSPCHVELAGDFGIVTALQEQVDNLLFARPQPNSLVLHYFPLCLILGLPWPVEHHGVFPNFIASTLPMRSAEANLPRRWLFTGTCKQTGELRNLKRIAPEFGIAVDFAALPARNRVKRRFAGHARHRN